jgi:hypothetical protein
VYDEFDCKGKPAKSIVAQKGKCSKGPDGTYYKISVVDSKKDEKKTGATILKAATIALIAFAANQF